MLNFTFHYHYPQVTLSWFLSFYFFCTHCNWLTPWDQRAWPGQGKHWNRQRNCQEGEPWWASSDASARSPVVSGPQSGDSQGKLHTWGKSSCSCQIENKYGRLSIIPSGLTTGLPSSHCPTSVWAAAQTLSRVGVCKSEWSVCVWRCGPHTTELCIFFYEPNYKVSPVIIYMTEYSILLIKQVTCPLFNVFKRRVFTMIGKCLADDRRKLYNFVHSFLHSFMYSKSFMDS